MADNLSSDILEFIEAIHDAKSIFENYEQDIDIAPEPIKLLFNTCKDLMDILSESEELFQKCNRSYPAQTILMRRLEETNNFISRHYGVKQDVEDYDTESRNRSVWKMDLKLFEKTKARMTHDTMMMECQKLIQFILVLSLRDMGVSLAAPSPAQLSGRLRPEGSKVQDIVRRLSEIKYQVGRRQSQMIQLGRSNGELDLSDLETKVEHEWRLLCLRAGFEDRSQRPPLPVSTRSLLLSTTQIYQSMVISYSRDRVIGPRSANLNVSLRDRMSILRGHSRSIPSGSLVSSSRQHDSQIASTQGSESGKHRINLGEPALPTYVAEFEMIQGRILKLEHWKCEHTTNYCTVQWTGVKNANILRHDFSIDTIPYTTHRSISKLEEGYSISFNGTSRVRWIRDGKQVLDERREDVKYRFIEHIKFQKFQEDFRDMDLLDTFDIETIKSSRKGWGEASNQDLKIWRSRDIDQIHTMTFYANHIKEHVEFPIEWFSPDFEIISKKKEVHISFKKKPGIANADPRSLPLFSRLSAGKKALRMAAADQASLRSSSSLTNSSRASISTMSSTRSNTGPNSNRVRALADLASNFEFLRIKFSEEEEDDEDEDEEDDEEDEEDKEEDFVRFVKLLKACLRNQDTSSAWTRSSTMD